MDIVFMSINASKSYSIKFDIIIVTEYRNMILYHTVIDVLNKNVQNFSLMFLPLPHSVEENRKVNLELAQNVDQIKPSL